MKINPIAFALILGIVVMMFVDFTSARATNSPYSIYFAVFVGALFSGFISRKAGWFTGLLVSIVSIIITVTIYFFADLNIYQPIYIHGLVAISSGLMGGIFGSAIREGLNEKYFNG